MYVLVLFGKRGSLFSIRDSNSSVGGGNSVISHIVTDNATLELGHDIMKEYGMG